MEKKPIENLELNRAKIELGNLKTKLRIQETKFKDLDDEHNALYNDSLKTITSYKKLYEDYLLKDDELRTLKMKIKSNWILRLLTKNF